MSLRPGSYPFGMDNRVSHPPDVTLGLDPRALHLRDVQQVQCPRVKPEGDD